MKTKTIVIANQKGGIGKTTTATAMATILKKKGFKTLLIDTDPQCNSSDSYRAKIEDEPTLFDVILDDETIPASEAIQTTDCGDIIPSDPLLRNADNILGSNLNGVFRLQEKLDELKNNNHYDYIIIDTNPVLNTILFSALIAADDLIIPITADRYAIQGLVQLQETLDTIKKRYNPNLKIIGLLLVKFNRRTRLSQEIQESLEKISGQLNTKLFKSTIRESIKVREAQAVRESLIDYASKSTSAEDYMEFVNEYLKVEGK